MMQHEFESRILGTVSPDDWEVIEHVYMWHPSIDDVKGKDQIAQLYLLGGMGLIQDMYYGSMRAHALTDGMNQTANLIAELKEKKDISMAEWDRKIHEAQKSHTDAAIKWSDFKSLYKKDIERR